MEPGDIFAPGEDMWNIADFQSHPCTVTTSDGPLDALYIEMKAYHNSAVRAGELVKDTDLTTLKFMVRHDDAHHMLNDIALSVMTQCADRVGGTKSIEEILRDIVRNDPDRN